MMEWMWILLLIVVGSGFLLAEVFMPGMILGILGSCSLLASILISYKTYGSGVGTAVLVGEILVVGAGLFLVMERLPKTKMGQSVMLSETNPDRALNQHFQKFIGQSGKLLTLCRPTGVALIQHERIDVTAEVGFIEEGTMVVVTRVEGTQVWVNPQSSI